MISCKGLAGTSASRRPRVGPWSNPLSGNYMGGFSEGGNAAERGCILPELPIFATALRLGGEIRPRKEDLAPVYGPSGGAEAG